MNEQIKTPAEEIFWETDTPAEEMFWETDTPNTLEECVQLLKFGAVLNPLLDQQHVDQARTEIRMLNCAEFIRDKLTAAVADIIHARERIAELEGSRNHWEEEARRYAENAAPRRGKAERVNAAAQEPVARWKRDPQTGRVEFEVIGDPHVVDGAELFPARRYDD